MNAMHLQQPKQPKRKYNRKAMALLIIFFAGIAAAVFFTSPLSKIRSITYEGNQQVSREQLANVSGIREGMNYWEVDKAAVDKRIQSQLPLVAKADVEVNFPGRVVVAVAEKPVAAILVLKGGSYYRLLSDGTVFDAVNSLGGTSLPILYTDRQLKAELGKRIEDAQIQQFCEQVVKVDRSLLSSIKNFQISDPKLWSAFTQDRSEIRFPPGDVSTILTTYMKFWKQQLQNKPPGIIYIYGNDEAVYSPREAQPSTKE
jgi:cell division protein FtsQ